MTGSQKACYKIKSALFLRHVYKVQFAVRKVQFQKTLGDDVFFTVF